MCRYISLLLFIGLVWGQETVISPEGKNLPGKYIGHDGTHVTFHFDDSKHESSFLISNIKGIISKDGSMMNLSIPENYRVKIYFKNGQRSEGFMKGSQINSIDKIEELIFKYNIDDKEQKFKLSQINYIISWNNKTIYPLGVVVNTLTGKYHLPTVGHLPHDKNRLFYESEDIAVSNNYNYCPACFNKVPYMTDYYLEKQLVRSAIMNYQNNHEIMYEHKDLNKIQKIMNDVLQKWPEKLKGYDYRVQVVRDDAINASAFGQGNLYFTTGLLNTIENDEELESIMAHEIAHVEKRHTLMGYYEADKAKGEVALKTLLVGLGAIVAGADASTANALLSITESVATYSAELALKGYGRSLEEEADIVADLYFYTNNKKKFYFKSMLDKLLTSQISKSGAIPQFSAYQSHPHILARINQVNNSKIYSFDQPLNLMAKPTEFKSIDDGFFNINVKSIYTAPSSSKNNKSMVYILGNLKNNHDELSFRINEMSITNNKSKDSSINSESYIITKDDKKIPINYLKHDRQKLYFTYIGKTGESNVPLTSIKDFQLGNKDAKDKIGKLILDGITGMSVRYKSDYDYIAKIETSYSDANLIFNSLKEKTSMISELKLSALLGDKKDYKPEKYEKYKSINCVMESFD